MEAEHAPQLLQPGVEVHGGHGGRVHNRDGCLREDGEGGDGGDGDELYREPHQLCGQRALPGDASLMP